jgi:hypothetical protein
MQALRILRTAVLKKLNNPVLPKNRKDVCEKAVDFVGYRRVYAFPYIYL